MKYKKTLHIIFGFIVTLVVFSFMAYGIDRVFKKNNDHIINLVSQNVIVDIDETTYQTGIYHAITEKGLLITFSNGEQWVVRNDRKAFIGGHIEPGWLIERRK